MRGGDVGVREEGRRSEGWGEMGATVKVNQPIAAIRSLYPTVT